MEKVQSKRDVYNFLAQECEAYLPKMDTVNIFFLKQITRGTKDVSILNSNILVCKAVSIEGSSSAIDRWSNNRRLSKPCKEEAIAT
jgi:hypothetical protein